MKTSNKILTAVILLAILPSIVILTLVVANTRKTVQTINNINIGSIRIVDARDANLILARDDKAHTDKGLIRIDSNIKDKEEMVKVVGDTLIISNKVTRICIPSAKLLLLSDTTVENPFFRKDNGYAVYVAKE
ncbi:MAG: hypothetical protein U0L45_07015 [Alistipes sp.]|jgi:hypothetical protein|nr:hypothetical protein [Alistipes sp.]MEE0916241.1 hypothetical protein [Alistipes sp.]